jgi:Castor and Pollux, part of voltage-gated ion channel/Calcium-activated potassium channel slowpoke-like RCK domain
VSPSEPSKRVFTARQKLRYRFDNTLSRGSTSLILWLAAITFTLILIGATILAVIGIEDPARAGQKVGFLEAFWLSLLRAIDPGTMGSDLGWPFRLVSLFVTIGGLFIAGSLIALLASAINRRVEELQAGRTIVAEHGHTLILGWSTKVFTIISELGIANENQADASIVILAPVDKITMEDAIHRRVPDTRGTRVVCRTGSPQDFADLRVANTAMAKSIIVLSSPSTDGDAGVIKAVLALLNGPLEISPTVPVVAEIAAPDTAEALLRATDGRISVVQSTRVIARLTAQVCRQPGLSSIYSDLFDFAGDEIYFYEEPRVTGRRFATALNAFESSSVIGICSAAGQVRLNPPMDHEVGEGDRLVVITADDDATVFSEPPETNGLTGSPRVGREHGRERFLLVGWNPLAPLILAELDAYAAPGSQLTLLVDQHLVPPGEVENRPKLRNIEVQVEHGPVPGDELDALMERMGFDHVVVLCYRDVLTEAEADSRVLLTLLQLRGSIQRAGAQTNVVAELLDERDVPLARGAGVDEFIVSERLTSLIMTQLSENALLEPVFDDLLDESGAEIYLKPASLYGADGVRGQFRDVVAAAAARGEVAIGWRKATGDEAVLNPRKSAPVELTSDDLVVVLSDDEG